MVAVFAINVRKGNVIERDGKLYVVLRAENIHPGKGTPVTQLEMRRISDGVKINERFKTTDQLEKAFIESRAYTYLYQDGDHYVFMDPQTYDQIHVSKDILGDSAAFLTENMEVSIGLHNGVPIEVELPPRAVAEVVETEPVVKGQTASGSFKPAVLANGVRTMVPTHITVGTRIVVSTDDGSYIERAKE
ncbi:MAG: elongation factor P [Alphaproteobacteria bacterium]